jgi:P4 family phage/plasmid primase-like protien
MNKRNRLQTEGYGELMAFLNGHTITQNQVGVKPTHIRIGNRADIYGGKYFIPEEEYNHFISLYHNAVIRHGAKEYLAEFQSPPNMRPIVVDIDLKYNGDTREKQHTSQHIEELIELYVAELKTMFQFEDTHKITCYVTEKPNVAVTDTENYVRDGIHLLFNILATKDCQEILRTRILAIVESSSWNTLPITNSWSDVFDLMVSKGTVPWQIYGSRKPGKDAYALTSVYEITINSLGIVELEDVMNEAMHTDIDTIHKMSTRNSTHNQDLFLTNAFTEELDAFFMQNNRQPQPQPQPQQEQAQQEQAQDQPPVQPQDQPPVQQEQAQYELTEIIDRFLNVGNAEELDECRILYERHLEEHRDGYHLLETYQYTMILPGSYYERGTREKWIRVGFALHSMGDIMFCAWVLFSAKQELFPYSCIVDLRREWQSFIHSENGFTKRSIKYWAKEGNLLEFNAKMQNNIDFHINKICDWALQVELKPKNCTDCDVANLLYYMYKDEHICADVRSNSWYVFQNHKWVVDSSGTILMNKMSREVRDLILTKKMIMIARLPSLQDYEKVQVQSKIQILNLVIKHVSNNPSKSGLLTEMRRLFFDIHFESKLDTNPSLMCFKNGVVDFKNKIFRKGVPEDYITKCTNIDFIEHDLTPLQEELKLEIIDFMEKLFPNRELLTYMWDHLASVLIGIQHDQTIHMYTGKGQNGKSVLISLLTATLGEYKGVVPLSLLTQARTKVGGLSPELLELKGVRLAVIQEPSAGDVINEGVMKQLTGGDPVQSRSPYMLNSITFIPQFTLIICSNLLMEIRTQDHGTWRRVRVADFESLFTAHPVQNDELQPYQFKLDLQIADKFHKWKEVFARLLVDIAFTTYGKVTPCQKVMDASNKYKNSQDAVTEFIDLFLCPSQGGLITKQVIQEKFIDWFINTQGSGKPPSNKDITTQMELKFKLIGSSWRNIAFKNNNSEE